MLTVSGGFAYFDDAFYCVSVKALDMGSDLFFDGPYYVPNKDAFKELEKNGVPVGDVTLPNLQERYAQRFAWVTGEDIEALWAYGGECANNGSFVYEYDNS